VGLGEIAQSAVLPAFRKARRNSTLEVLVSGDAEKLKRLGDKYDVAKRYLYTEFEACLQRGEVDAVYIATPNAYHRNIMETAAKYGVHVLCEKPLAVTAEDCLSMITEAEKHHVFLMVAYRLHFEPANLWALRLAHGKRIGDLRVFNSVFTFQVRDPGNIRLVEVERGGGALYDIGVYCINAARHLFKAEPIEVFALSDRTKDSRFKKTDESVSCVLKFPEGRLATFSVSFGAFAAADFDLIGTKGRLRLEKGYNFNSSRTLKIYEDRKIISRKFAPELVYFSDCVQKKKRPEMDGEEGLQDVKIVEALLLSIDLGAPITLEEINRRARPAEARPEASAKLGRRPFARPRPFNVFSSGTTKH
jgi:glucose-fructose oxidoreductase